MADGPTMLDALRNVQRVAEEWIETAKSLGRPIPPAPRQVLLYA
jgi:predicted RNase H-like HicB family nuclease